MHLIQYFLLHLLLVNQLYSISATASVTVELSANENRRHTVTLNIGDTLVIRCNEGFYAEIVEQSRAQVDACDNSLNNPDNKYPVRISACLGFADNHSIQIETASEILESSQVFNPGQSYYYTSFSLINLTSLSAGLYGRQSGGLCSAGFELELHVTEPTTAPVSTFTEYVNGTTKDPTNGTINDVRNATISYNTIGTTNQYLTGSTDTLSTGATDPPSTDATDPPSTGGGGTVTLLSTSSAVILSVGVTFVVAFVTGTVTGLIIMYLCTRKKKKYSVSQKL